MLIAISYLNKYFIILHGYITSNKRERNWNDTKIFNMRSFQSYYEHRHYNMVRYGIILTVIQFTANNAKQIS